MQMFYSQAGHLFDSVAEQLDYMEQYGFEVARKTFYKNIGDFKSAGELHLRDGERGEAATCFLQSADPQSRGLAIACVTDGLRGVAFGSDFDENSRNLLQLLDDVPAEEVPSEQKVEVS